MQIKNNKMIIILGPTATGKTKLAVDLAKKYNGEIISADSRQIYKYLDIGTGKDLEDYKNIPYHLIDIIEPEVNYSVYTFQKDFIKSYEKIIKKGKTPILCGGTGLYIESILLDYNISNRQQPDSELRQKLSKKNIIELTKYFEKINDNIIKNPKMDTKNRIIRNIEICLNKNKINTNQKKNRLPIKSYKVIGIFPGREEVKKNITIRLKKRIDEGLIQEVKNLLNEKTTKERLHYFGLEYRYINNHLNGFYKEEELFNELNRAIHKFAKKQMTFFRRMEKRGIKIEWIKKPDIMLVTK